MFIPAPAFSIFNFQFCFYSRRGIKNFYAWGLNVTSLTECPARNNCFFSTVSSSSEHLISSEIVFFVEFRLRLIKIIYFWPDIAFGGAFLRHQIIRNLSVHQRRFALEKTSLFIGREI